MVKSKQPLLGVGAILSVLVVGSFVLGCDEDSQTAPQGELGQGTFEHRCTLPSDVFCSSADTVDSFKVTRDFGNRKGLPQAVAIDSLFELRYSGPDRDITLKSAIARDSAGPGLFSIGEPAFAAFLAWDHDDNVLDFATVEARPIATLAIWQNQLDANVVELDAGDMLNLTVTPLSSDHTLLAGALPYQWTSSDTKIVQLSGSSQETPSREVRNLCDVVLVAENPGTASVTVRSGDYSTQLKVIVR